LCSVLGGGTNLRQKTTRKKDRETMEEEREKTRETKIIVITGI
jgi:hypothetical protein